MAGHSGSNVESFSEYSRSSRSTSFLSCPTTPPDRVSATLSAGVFCSS